LSQNSEFGCPRPKSTVSSKATAIKSGQSVLCQLIENEEKKLRQQKEMEKQKQALGALGDDLEDIELQKALMESMQYQ